MHPILLRIGHFELASYGLMTALGYLAAAGYLVPRLKTCSIKGLDKDTFWNLLFIVFLGALIGGKLLFILVSWHELGATLAEKLVHIVQEIRYGFVFFGGMILAVLGALGYMRYKKLPILKTSDFLIVGLPLGHALGRMGCFLAGCCYGKPSTLPWAVRFTDPHALVPSHLVGVPLHPTQVYEAVLNLLLFIFLHYASQKPHKSGQILVLYIGGYAVMRFFIEFFRGDFRGGFIAGLSPSQLISLATAIAAVIIWKKYVRSVPYDH